MYFDSSGLSSVLVYFSSSSWHILESKKSFIHSVYSFASFALFRLLNPLKDWQSLAGPTWWEDTPKRKDEGPVSCQDDLTVGNVNVIETPQPSQRFIPNLNCLVGDKTQRMADVETSPQVPPVKCKHKTLLNTFIFYLGIFTPLSGQ